MNAEGITVYLNESQKRFGSDVFYSFQQFKTLLVNYGKNDGNLRGNSFFDTKSGGYYMIRSGHNPHEEEGEAAKILALNGSKVILQPEDKTKGGKSLKGDTFFEGYLDGEPFELSTLENATPNSANKAIFHAHKKGVLVSVIYDRNNTLTKELLQGAIKHYWTQKTKTPKRRYKRLIIVRPNRVEEVDM